MVAQPMAAHARVLVLADAAADGRAGVALPHRPQGKRFKELHGLLASECAAVDLLGDVADELPEILRLPGAAGGFTAASSRRRCTRRLIHERGRRRVHEKVSRCRDLGKALRGFLDIFRIAVGVPAHGKLLECGGDHLGIGRTAVSTELDAEHLGGLLQQGRHFGALCRADFYENRVDVVRHSLSKALRPASRYSESGKFLTRVRLLNGNCTREHALNIVSFSTGTR